MNPERPLVVVKLGGSLLDWRLLPDRLSEELTNRRSQRVVLIVGGGQVVEILRALDQIHQFGEHCSHRLALRALDLNAYCIAALGIGLEVAENVSKLPTIWNAGRVPILLPRPLLDDDDRHVPDPLPHHWCVTSDSIAARVAARLNASELVLLKSAPLPHRANRDEAAQLGLVDSYFPFASRALPRITYRNLRDETCSGQPLA